MTFNCYLSVAAMTHSSRELPKIRLSSNNQKNFDLLIAGHELSSREVAAIRENLYRLLMLINKHLFAHSSGEYQAWVKQSQAYTEGVLETLTNWHFRKCQ